MVNLVTGQSRLVYQAAGDPDLIASDRTVRYLLLQIRNKDGGRVVRLIRLDLTTGKAADLPAGKFGLPAILRFADLYERIDALQLSLGGGVIPAGSAGNRHRAIGAGYAGAAN